MILVWYFLTLNGSIFGVILARTSAYRANRLLFFIEMLLPFQRRCIYSWSYISVIQRRIAVLAEATLSFKISTDMSILGNFFERFDDSNISADVLGLSAWWMTGITKAFDDSILTSLDSFKSYLKCSILCPIIVDWSYSTSMLFVDCCGTITEVIKVIYRTANIFYSCFSCMNLTLLSSINVQFTFQTWKGGLSCIPKSSQPFFNEYVMSKRLAWLCWSSTCHLEVTNCIWVLIESVFVLFLSWIRWFRQHDQSMNLKEDDFLLFSDPMMLHASATFS